MTRPLSWIGILRLGLVQMALGSVLVLTNSTLNRVMTVELALPALLPGFLVSLYYATQALRPRFGHGADQGGRRSPWILGGVLALGAGALGASASVGLMAQSTTAGIALAVPSYLLIGFGIGAAGTNLLALLAARCAPERLAAAGSAVWIMMIFGLAFTGITAGQFLDPYAPERLMQVTLGVALAGLALTVLGIWGQERVPARPKPKRDLPFREVVVELWSDARVRAFTVFVFASMLAYNLQDLILEPFGGHVFGMAVGETTKLGGAQHGGALAGMLVVLVTDTALRRWITVPVRVWIVGGCVLSGLALIGLAIGGMHGPGWPVTANVFALGLANGAFAVAAIGAMMGLAREGSEAREGARMGLFGAAQAIAFGLGSFLGTALADLMRSVIASDALAYGSVFAAEGAVFLVAAGLALRLSDTRPVRPVAAIAGE